MTEEKKESKIVKWSYVFKSLSGIKDKMPALKDSREVQVLQSDILNLTVKVSDTDAKDQGELKKEFTSLKKRIEGERGKINNPLNEIKAANQDIFRPLLDAHASLKKESEGKYAVWFRAETERRRKYQEELDRKAEEERKKQEAMRKEAEKNNELSKFIGIPVVAPKVAPVEVNKQMLPKSIEIEITNIIDFITYAVSQNDEELLDCIQITKKTGIEAKVRRNPGKYEKNIIPGTHIILKPNKEAWGIKD
jgi:hypothetical protein